MLLLSVGVAPAGVEAEALEEVVGGEEEGEEGQQRQQRGVVQHGVDLRRGTPLPPGALRLRCEEVRLSEIAQQQQQESIKTMLYWSQERAATRPGATTMMTTRMDKRTTKTTRRKAVCSRT